MQDFKRGLFTMLGLCTGSLVFATLYKLVGEATTEKCKGEEVKVEEAVEKTE